MVQPYRVLVTGSRDWDDKHAVWHTLASTILANAPADAPVVVVHGACPGGADFHAAAWAQRARADGRRPVEEERHPAQRHRTQDFGPWPGAGPRRNAYMVGLGADCCLAFIGPCTSPRCRRPDPHPSHGASGCADLAENVGI
ncbi:MAG: DUF2493 domain-containing protein, partial [Streptomyces sp.]|nr:DUF2493 domain-containing protein [Streptomyces sp.]